MADLTSRFYLWRAREWRGREAQVWGGIRVAAHGVVLQEENRHPETLLILLESVTQACKGPPGLRYGTQYTSNFIYLGFFMICNDYANADTTQV